MTEDFPVYATRYSKLSRLGFGIAFLILGYSSIGMMTGLIAVEADQRLQQVLIGLCFLALAIGCAIPLAIMFRSGAKPVFSLDHDGVWDRRLTTEPIPWSLIAEVQRFEPGFVERLVTPSGRGGKIILHIAPDAWDRIPFTHAFVGPLHTGLLAGSNRLRIFHGTLDTSFQALAGVLVTAWQFAKNG